MAREASAVAHAKVNLELTVLAREADGHHGLQTVFQRLELGDDVRVRVDAPGRSLDCTGPELPPDGLGPVERNLAWRAAIAYAEATGWPAGFAIEVVKRVPAGGGLGGGSADAGAVLRCLDALAPRPVGEAALVAIATPLGADVPFLASERTRALAWSRGERMLALADLPPRPVALLLPPYGTSTADAYGRLASLRRGFTPRAELAAPEELAGWAGAERRARNDFEAAVEGALHPELPACLAWLRERGARIALLAGSGSTVFGVFEEGGAPLAPEPPPPCRVVHTRTLARVVAVQRIG